MPFAETFELLFDFDLDELLFDFDLDEPLFFFCEVDFDFFDCAYALVVTAAVPPSSISAVRGTRNELIRVFIYFLLAR